jgi:hypothetical protein
VGTGSQPEDDATPTPGTRCLYTAPNAGGNLGIDDVDGGHVVARSGSYDVTGHPEARVSVSRWFANRDVGVDAGDFFRLHIRQSAASPDQLLEELPSAVSAPAWTEVTFRVSDFVVPGADVQLKVTASDGTAVGNIVEAAIDEVLFWDPACDLHDPPPNVVFPLRADRTGDDVVLSWPRPPIDPAHGETENYLVYRSEAPSGGFAITETVFDPAEDVSWTDAGAAASPAPFYAWLVVSANPSGVSETVP